MKKDVKCIYSHSALHCVLSYVFFYDINRDFGSEINGLMSKFTYCYPLIDNTEIPTREYRDKQNNIRAG